jgi:hypothetical protein
MVPIPLPPRSSAILLQFCQIQTKNGSRGRVIDTPKCCASHASRFAGVPYCVKEWAERGAIAPMAALLLIPMLSMLALTVDIGYAFGQRRLAQNVADSAALNATLVVGKRLQAATDTWVKDGDVIQAISSVASRSSGGFTYGPGLAGEYVKWETGGIITKVGDVGVGVTCASDLSPGCIPDDATGVRVVAQTTFNTFFGQVLNRLTLSTSARATALNETVVKMSDIAPYALWTGEDGADGDGDGVDRQLNGGTPPDFLCRDSNDDPIELRINGNTVNAPAGSYRSPSGKAYDYSCQAGTGSAIAAGTIFPIRAAPNYETPNVSTGNPNWQVGSSNFKGFIRVDDPLGFVGAGDYVSDGGIAGGNEDAGMAIIHNCYVKNCTLIMPIVSYAIADASSGHPQLLVAGFVSVKVSGPVNSEDPTTAPTSYIWKAAVVNAPVTCCPVVSTPEVTPGSSALLVSRLYL